MPEGQQRSNREKKKPKGGAGMPALLAEITRLTAGKAFQRETDWHLRAPRER